MSELAVFVTERLRDNESDVHIAALPHAFCETVAGGAKTTEDMRGEFPPEH